MTLHGNIEPDSLYNNSVLKSSVIMDLFSLSGPTQTRRWLQFRQFANEHSSSNDSGSVSI